MFTSAAKMRGCIVGLLVTSTVRLMSLWKTTASRMPISAIVLLHNKSTKYAEILRASILWYKTIAAA
jgi:hypothetical protein